jgi:outer membrane protein
MRTITVTLSSFLAALIIGLATGVAQQADPDTMKLSFAGAVDLADKNNSQIQAALAGLEKAEAQIGEAWSAALPTLTASGAYTRNFIIPEIVVSIPEPTKFRFTQENVWGGQISLNQTLYSAGRVGLGLKIAKLYHEMTQEGVALSRSQVRLLVTQSYFGAVLAGEGESIAHQTYAQMQDHLKQVEALRREGLVSEYDLIRSQVQVSNFYPQVLAAETGRTIAYATLVMVLGLPKDEAIQLTDSMEAYPTPNLPQDDLYTMAVQRRSELRQLDLRTRIQEKLVTAEQHGVIWPNVALTGGYSVSAQEADFQFKHYYWSRNLYAGVGVSIPLFDGFKAKHRVQQARADLKTLRIQQDQLEKGINLEIIQARDKFNQSQKNLTAQQDGVRLAQKGLDIANLQYTNGLNTQLEVMDAQIALNQAQMNLLAAHYDLITAQAQLEKAIGDK